MLPGIAPSLISFGSRTSITNAVGSFVNCLNSSNLTLVTVDILSEMRKVPKKCKSIFKLF